MKKNAPFDLMGLHLRYQVEHRLHGQLACWCVLLFLCDYCGLDKEFHSPHENLLPMLELIILGNSVQLRITVKSERRA